MGKVTRKNEENVDVKKVKEVLHVIRTTQEEKQAKGQERERGGIHVNDKKPESMSYLFLISIYVLLTSDDPLPECKWPVKNKTGSRKEKEEEEERIFEFNSLHKLLFYTHNMGHTVFFRWSLRHSKPFLKCKWRI